jgi:hypothetical protein
MVSHLVLRDVKLSGMRLWARRTVQGRLPRALELSRAIQLGGAQPRPERSKKPIHDERSWRKTSNTRHSRQRIQRSKEKETHSY